MGNELIQRVLTSLGLLGVGLFLYSISSDFARDVILLVMIIGSAIESSSLLNQQFMAYLFFMIVMAWFFPSLALVFAGLAWFVIFLDFWAQVFDLELLLVKAYALLQACVVYGAYLAFEIPPAVFFMAIMIAVVMDVFAFLSGKFFGRHRGVISSSPNKSLEGFMVGFLASSIFGALMGLMLWQSALLALMAMAGDAWASSIKRQARVKDSGYILPGHGGILDRVDSWLPCLFLIGFF